MSKNNSRQKGNMLITVTVFIGIIFLIVAFIVINFNSIFGSNKEAQSAIDAVALRAAQDLSTIYIGPGTTVAGGSYHGELGFVGLVDIPANATNNPTPGKSFPVLGINTVLATLTLDSLIVSQLGSSGCNAQTNMGLLLTRDLQYASNACNDLGALIALYENGTNTLPNGLTLQTDLQNVFSNPDIRKRFGNGTLSGSITITMGQQPYNAKTTTNILIPNGASSSVTSSNSYYVPNTTQNLPVPSGSTVTLANSSNEISLVDNSLFNAVDPTSIDSTGTAVIAPPAIVKVECDTLTTGKAPMPSGGNPTYKIHNIACAVITGPIVTNLSTAYELDFPSGFPPFVASGTPLYAVNILNFNNWNITSKGPNWITSNSTNSFPMAAEADYNGFPTTTTSQQSQSTPEAAFAYTLYDWLRSNGLRPDMNSTVTALNNTDLTSFTMPVATNTPPLVPPQTLPQAGAFMVTGNGSYLGSLVNGGCYSALLAANGTANDPGTIAYSNIFSGQPPGVTTPSNAAAFAFDSTNTLKTCSNTSITNTQNLIGDLARTNHAAKLAAEAANKILGWINGSTPASSLDPYWGGSKCATYANQGTGQSTTLVSMQASNPTNYSLIINKITASANNVLANAANVMHTTYLMTEQLNAITAGGIVFNSTTGTYNIDTFTFSPLIDFANVDTYINQLNGNSQCSFLQDLTTNSIGNSPAPKDIAIASIVQTGVISGSTTLATYPSGSAITPPYPDWNTATAIPHIYTNSLLTPAITNNITPVSDWFTQPAAAATSASPAQSFLLTIYGDAQYPVANSTPISGAVVITPIGLSPFCGLATAPGQLTYDGANNMSYVDPTSGSTIYWSAFARDMLAYLAKYQTVTPAQTQSNMAGSRPQGNYNTPPAWGLSNSSWAAGSNVTMTVPCYNPTAATVPNHFPDLTTQLPTYLLSAASAPASITSTSAPYPYLAGQFIVTYPVANINWLVGTGNPDGISDSSITNTYAINVMPFAPASLNNDRTDPAAQ